MPARARCVWSKSELTRQTCSEQLDRTVKRQMVNVRQDHIIPNFPRLANMAWTYDLAKQHAPGQPEAVC